MGSIYLTDLADVCRRTGYPVVEVGGAPGQTGDQWKRRGRSGNTGYNSGRPNHIMVHHTASSPSTSGWGDANYCTFSADAKPICNILLSRPPVKLYVCAAGPTNTNGSGEDPCGVSNDSMNSDAIGIEGSNNGVGEPWDAAMMDCYLKLCGELEKAYGIANGRLHSHWEYAGYRGKIDPAGPPRPFSGTPAPMSWDMNAFRNDVAGVTPPGPRPPQPSKRHRHGVPYQEDDMPAALIVDNTVGGGNYFALSPNAFTWLWDETSLRAMQDAGTLTGRGLEGAVVLPWETCQHYMEMSGTGDRWPAGYTVS